MCGWTYLQIRDVADIRICNNQCGAFAIANVAQVVTRPEIMGSKLTNRNLQLFDALASDFQPLSFDSQITVYIFFF